jgi:hypothetical protein
VSFNRLFDVLQMPNAQQTSEENVKDPVLEQVQEIPVRLCRIKRDHRVQTFH